MWANMKAKFNDKDLKPILFSAVRASHPVKLNQWLLQPGVVENLTPEYRAYIELPPRGTSRKNIPPQQRGAVKEAGQFPTEFSRRFIEEQAPLSEANKILWDHYQDRIAAVKEPARPASTRSAEEVEEQIRYDGGTAMSTPRRETTRRASRFTAYTLYRSISSYWIAR